MTVNAGVGISSSDRQNIDSRLNRLEEIIASRLTILENKVNTSLQNVGAGIGIEYLAGKDKTCKDCWEDINKVLVCPFGKRHNLVYSGGYSSPGTPPMYLIKFPSQNKKVQN